MFISSTTTKTILFTFENICHRVKFLLVLRVCHLRCAIVICHGDPSQMLLHLLFDVKFFKSFFVLLRAVFIPLTCLLWSTTTILKHCWSNIFLGLRLKKHKRAIQAWELNEDEDSTEKLNVYGLNEEQWQIPVIEQLIVSKPEGGYKVLGYMVNRALKAHVYNDEAGNDPDSYHCKRCLAWFGSKWRFCEQCCLKIDDLKRELRDHQETDDDAKDKNEYTRYKTWYKRKRKGARKYKT